MFELHVYHLIRKKYGFDSPFFSTNGRVIFANFQAVRLFVYKINQMRTPQLHVYPGEVNAAGLIEEIYHILLRQYESQVNPDVFVKAEKHLIKTIGEQKLNQLLLDFTTSFPPADVYAQTLSSEDYLKQNTNGRPNRLISIEELIMLWFANFNPGNKKLKELFDEDYLADVQLFQEVIQLLEAFFLFELPYGPEKTDIFTLLKSPVKYHPDDLSAQLDYILKYWKDFLPENIIIQLLKSKDLLSEDVTFGTAGGPPPAIAPIYKGTGDSGFSIGKSGYLFIKESTGDYEEPEQFTSDIHWMPRVVLLAKNTYVWLDQLSKKYGREIRTLDQIPDEELDQLVKWNFTGLWLIGIWERSEASRRIKHIMGNIDAVSSAYSLYDYEIAQDLGGEKAFQHLNQRAVMRGLRLASDMVPNHTGIYSKWIIEHPDYFIQSDTSPFPGYRFTGENLSPHNDFEIKLEDGYYSRTDAAVVFKWINKRNGQVRYIYHGNDGTSMPWNDTAQLDMIKKEVREAVIQKIFDVAQKFSIIRFDAAMTLAKKHFSRLWYPQPGSGGDIPSRADYAMTREAFDDLFPVEFWREVVDRINENMPETLLLAEAFWFMEGYFVRTLGMHRVYNSAFMHMLKNEENAKYRDLITNTLEFEPEILKRYVNFMSNPDEETAIRQFGTGDKYFGVCVLMNTLPGLPMFAHGQIEGFSEKYGMEYQRAYYNEIPQQWLIEKHEREIFPLTGKRYLFSEVESFNIFDYTDGYGNINENVFAYTNRYHDQRVMVFFNNKYEQAFGGIHTSAPKLTLTTEGKKLLTVNVARALNLKTDKGVYYIFREHISNLEYLRSGSEIMENGFQWNLNGFEYRLFWNFTELTDEKGDFSRLHQHLEGKGVPDIRKAMIALRLQPVHQAFEGLFTNTLIDELTHFVFHFKTNKQTKIDTEKFASAFNQFITKVESEFDVVLHHLLPTENFLSDIQSLEKLYNYFTANEKELLKIISKPGFIPLLQTLTIDSSKNYVENLHILYAYFILRNIRTFSPGDVDPDEFIGQFALELPLQHVFKMTGAGHNEVIRNINLVNNLVTYGHEIYNFESIAQMSWQNTDPEALKTFLKNKATLALRLIEDEFVQELIGVNEYEGVRYFSKELFEDLSDWLLTLALLHYFKTGNLSNEQLGLLIKQSFDLWTHHRQLLVNAGYQLNKLRNFLLASD